MFYIWTFSFKSFQLYPILFVVVFVFPFLINFSQILTVLYKRGHSLIDLTDEFLVIKIIAINLNLNHPQTHTQNIMA
jgi:hypothetical protein